MIVNMVLVDVSANNKGIVTLCQLHGKLITDLICFFRRNLTWQERLTKMIADHIVSAAPPTGLPEILLLRQRKLNVGGHGITLIAGDQSAVIRLFGILSVIDNLCNRGRGRLPFADMERNEPRGRYTIIPFAL